MKASKPAFAIDQSPEELLDLGDSDLLAQCIRLALEQSQGAERQRAHSIVGHGNPKEGLILQILPVLDGFDRILQMAERQGLAASPDIGNWIKSVEALYRRLRKILEKEGLKEIESVGRVLDFDVHEVVEVREDHTIPDRVIIDEEQKGYRLKEKVLREAKVIVAQPTARGSNGGNGNGSSA